MFSKMSVQMTAKHTHNGGNEELMDVMKDYLFYFPSMNFAKVRERFLQAAISAAANKNRLKAKRGSFSGGGGGLMLIGDTKKVFPRSNRVKQSLMLPVLSKLKDS